MQPWALPQEVKEHTTLTEFIFHLFYLFFVGKVELHGKVLEVEHSVPKRQR